MFRDFFRGHSFLGLLLAFLILAGCGDSGPAEYDVTGSVTLDGQPIEKGEILFLPAICRGRRRPARL